MDEAKLLERITVNPKTFGGKPIIRERRLAPVYARRLVAHEWVEPLVKETA